MAGTLTRGLVAGAAGTLALDATTYADIALRGRAPSSVPTDAVHEVLAERGVALDENPGTERARHREEGVAALSGYAVGVGTGLALALSSPLLRRMPFGVRALLAGAAAMVAGNAGGVIAGATDPRRWGIEGWVADALPHLAYGGVAAATLGMFDRNG